MRRILGLLLLSAFFAVPAAQAAPGGVPGVPGAQVSKAAHHDHSKPLRDITPAKPQEKEKEEKRVKELPGLNDGMLDPVVQISKGSASAPVAGAGFEGIGQGFSGPAGTFTVNSAPPDTNGAVGPNNYVQVVNQSFAVFDKTGKVLYGPAPTNTLWSGFGGGCQTNDDGDATVEYDRAADRWIISQFSVSTLPYLQCVAVSQTGDPTGAYNRYSFSYGNTQFPDYPKLGVWADGYYTTFNIFNNGNTFAGPKVCAYDRASMLAGQPATQQCFQLGTNYGGLLPSDLDSSTAPPAGSPNYVMDFAANALELWQFHVDWTNAANSTLSATPSVIPVAGFTGACNLGGTCIPQGGTTNKLDSLADRLMYRLAYRNFGDHESLVVNHSVTAGTATGVRWYELREPSTQPGWSVYQQGTYAPNDGVSRWMGSAAMDGNGDIGLGFSTSSPSAYPGLAYTGRLASDPTLGVMTQGEATLIAGKGSQIGGLNRWGDYSSLSIDPSDDCTFWFTSEYLGASGSFNWHTRVGSFKLPGCNTPPDYSLGVSPSSASVVQGNTANYTVNVNPVNGFGNPVDLTVSGLPGGASASFNPTPVTPPGSSTLSIATGSAQPGSYPLTITGTSGALTHTVQATLVITSSTPPDFSISASPTSQTASRGGSTSYTVSITRLNGFTGTVSLSVSGTPRRVSASFAPSSISNPGTTSTMTVSVSRQASTGTSTLTVKGTSGSLTHSASAVSLKVV